MMKLTIVGAGNVGITLSLKTEQIKDLDYELIYNSRKSFENAIEKGVSKEKLISINEAKFDSQYIILCVPDSEIENLVDLISQFDTDILISKIIFHTSGTRTKECLSSLEKFECSIAAAHPYQTFFYNEPNILNGIAWGIDAETKVFDKLKVLIEKLDGIPIKLSSEAVKKKGLYHISAVAASNFMALSIEFAKDIAKDAGIEVSEFLPKILETTLHNNIRQLNSNIPAITGPVVRGDSETISSHLEELGNTANGVIYRNMCESLALLAMEKGILAPEKFEQILDILES